MVKIIKVIALIVISSVFLVPSNALTTAPQIAPDKESGYDRSLFKHWIDANKNGCDTRAEVLVAEAIVKPKVGKKCKLTGGKWLSAYDGKTLTDASKLDVDHLVPLAEAWRSGAWAWTAKQRQDYANDLSDSRALIAVTLTTNRSKSDKDISDWVPKIDTCGYVQNWIAIKVRYSLTYDAKEAESLFSYFEVCKFGDIPVQALAGYTYQTQTVQPGQPSPSPTALSTPIPSATPVATPAPTISTTPTATPTPSPTQEAAAATVSPGAFCSPAGATGKSANGTTYTCKTSATDTRNRWRQ